MSRIPTEWEDHPEYSVEWFRVLYHFHDEWLGIQGKKLWEHYAQLEAALSKAEYTADAWSTRAKKAEAENERLREELYEAYCAMRDAGWDGDWDNVDALLEGGE